MSSIPDGFEPEFLDWFRARTEAAWANIPEATPEETLAKYVNWGVGGCSWQRGTKWLNGLSDEQIDTVEARWNLCFPPDFRLFLQHLQCVDRPVHCAGYFGIGEAPEPDGDYLAVAFDQRGGQYMALDESSSFYNWIDGQEYIEAALERVTYGLLFDVEHNVLWPESWGTKPDIAGKREQRVRELIAAAPKLIPVFEHRFLLAESCEAGNPILSIHQSDIIVYGVDLHDYFVIEFCDATTSDERDALKTAEARRSDIGRYESIPFWGEFL